MYIITGGAGFIGSAFASHLNQQGINGIIVVDESGNSPRWKNICGKLFVDYFNKNEFLTHIERDTLPYTVTAIVHLGACSSTTELDADFLMRNNYRYSVSVAEYCNKHSIRLVYASSAATYGDGEQGYSDTISLKDLRPLNPYGFSKHAFDLYMQRRNFYRTAVGVKFFNVFGPNEYHKGEMTSVVYKSWQQITSGEPVKLFRSQKPEFKDGEQKRDFIYVKDCSKVLFWLMENKEVTGLLNLGTGKARSWNDLVRAVYAALEKRDNIEYIDMPLNLSRQYQYFTEANMERLAKVGCKIPFSTLEESVKDYVCNYLQKPMQYI